MPAARAMAVGNGRYRELKISRRALPASLRFRLAENDAEGEHGERRTAGDRKARQNPYVAVGAFSLAVFSKKASFSRYFLHVTFSSDGPGGCPVDNEYRV